MCDRDGLITYFNRRAVEINRREPLLHDARDRYCGSFRLFARDGTPLPHERSRMARVLSENREYNSCEIVVEQPGGRRVAVLAHANPMHGEDGELMGAVNLLTDITDRKRSERAKDDFLELLGHELRNPLGPVSNAVHILRGKPAPDEQSRWALDLIERQVEDLVSLIEQVAEVSRLSRGDVMLARSAFSVAELVSPRWKRPPVAGAQETGLRAQPAARRRDRPGRCPAAAQRRRSTHPLRVTLAAIGGLGPGDGAGVSGPVDRPRRFPGRKSWRVERAGSAGSLEWRSRPARRNVGRPEIRGAPGGLAWRDACRPRRRLRPDRLRTFRAARSAARNVAPRRRWMSRCR